MVAAGRRARRRPRGVRLPRLVVVGLVLSALVVAVNSIVATSAEGPEVSRTYADRVRPAIDRSIREGAAFGDLRASAADLGRNGLRRSLDRLERDTRQTVSHARRVDPPDEVSDDHGLLITALATRAESVSRVTEALTGALGTGPPEPVVQALVEVGRDLAVADRAYALFLAGLPEPARAVLPLGAWVIDEAAWAHPEIATFVSTLWASATLAPVHDVALVTFATEPSPVAADGDAAVLPLSRVVGLQVVVANVGNEAERRVAVAAEVTSDGGMDTARQFVDLAAGQRMTVPLTVRPSPVGQLSLVVKVGPLNGEVNIADNEQSKLYVMR